MEIESLFPQGQNTENPYGEAVQVDEASAAINPAVASLPPEQILEVMEGIDRFHFHFLICFQCYSSYKHYFNKISFFIVLPEIQGQIDFLEIHRYIFPVDPIIAAEANCK